MRHHKYEGISHLERDIYSLHFLEKIFKNPRIHSRNGRYVELRDRIGDDVRVCCSCSLKTTIYPFHFNA